jgi:hypothetical protein
MLNVAFQGLHIKALKMLVGWDTQGTDVPLKALQTRSDPPKSLTLLSVYIFRLTTVNRKWNHLESLRY